MGHLFGLSHTVLYNNSKYCPTDNFRGPLGQSVDTNCDDGCPDTPTAWYITDVLEVQNGVQTKVHPGISPCGWKHGGITYCSNNQMDYAGSPALTACQLGIIHTGLSAGLSRYTVCDALASDNNYTDIGFPKVSYYGNNVTIGTSNSIATLDNKEEAHIYFSNQVVLNPLEITGKTVNFSDNSDIKFEVILPVCTGTPH